MGIGIEDGGIYVAYNFLVAGLLVLAGILLWGQSIIGATDWRNTRNPVQPSLQAGMSPFDRMYNGVTGCLAAVILRIWAVILWSVALFVLFFGYQELVILFMVLIGAYIP